MTWLRLMDVAPHMLTFDKPDTGSLDSKSLLQKRLPQLFVHTDQSKQKAY